MKKLILFLILAGALVGGYFWVVKYGRIDIGVLTGERARTREGDLEVPITASGYIKPASVTELKSKASGEVTFIYGDPGLMVRRDERMVQLLEIYEQRNVDQAEANYNRAVATAKQAKIKREELETAGIKLAKAKYDSMVGARQAAKARYEFYKKQSQPGPDGSPPVMPKSEWDQIDAAMIQADANVLAAEADKEQAELAVQAARQDEAIAKENVNSTEAALKDARQRFKDTTVYSPINGMILSKRVQVGEVVSSAQTSFTGGNLLMEIADVSEVYAVVNVDEADIGQVHELAPASARPGPTASTQPSTRPAAGSASGSAKRQAEQPATTEPESLPEGTFDQDKLVDVTVESFPDVTFKGTITRISPQSEASGGVATFKVWIRIVDPPESKATTKPATGEKKIGKKEQLVGMLNTQAEAHFTAKSVRNAVLVSYDAVKKNPDGEDYGVYVPVIKPGSTRPEPVFVRCKFGADNGIEIEVRSGLKKGQEVYTKLPQKTEKQEREEAAKKKKSQA